jgi:hypothetical protein
MANQSSFIKNLPPSNRNLLINGSMNVNQRFEILNNISYNPIVIKTLPSGLNQYITDRWFAQNIQFPFTSLSGNLVYQTVYDAPTASTSLTKSIQITVQTIKPNLSSTDTFTAVGQQIENVNCNVLKYGTPQALNITISFWVKSSVAGNYTMRYKTFGSLAVPSDNSQYLAQYSINTPNNWEYKSITVPGNTTYTLATAAGGSGLQIAFQLADGTLRQTNLANQWISEGISSPVYRSLNTQTNFVSTLSATFNITGIQLEIGSKATEFEYKPYFVELEACRRYYQKPLMQHSSTKTNVTSFPLPVSMRATPTVVASVTPTSVTKNNVVMPASTSYTLSSLDADYL